MSADATPSRRPQSNQSTRVDGSEQNEAAAPFRPSRVANATRQHAVNAGNGEPHQQQATADDILSVNEVAEFLKLSPRTVGEYGARGVLPSVKIGRHRRFSRRQLETLIAVGQKGGAEGERPGLRAQDIAAV